MEVMGRLVASPSETECTVAQIWKQEFFAWAPSLGDVEVLLKKLCTFFLS